MHGDAVSRCRRRHVTAVADDAGLGEVLVQVIDILGDPVVEGRGNGDVVDDREVLDVFAKTDTAGM